MPEPSHHDHPSAPPPHPVDRAASDGTPAAEPLFRVEVEIDAWGSGFAGRILAGRAIAPFAGWLSFISGFERLGREVAESRAPPDADGGLHGLAGRFGHPVRATRDESHGAH